MNVVHYVCKCVPNVIVSWSCSGQHSQGTRPDDHSYGICVTWARSAHARWSLNSHVRAPYRTMALMHSKSLVPVACTLQRGRVNSGHTDPLRQPWWQQSPHLGNPLCLSFVGLSFTSTHCSYLCSIQIVLEFITYYCTMQLLSFIYILKRHWDFFSNCVISATVLLLSLMANRQQWRGIAEEVWGGNPRQI